MSDDEVLAGSSRGLPLSRRDRQPDSGIDRANHRRQEYSSSRSDRDGDDTRRRSDYDHRDRSFVDRDGRPRREEPYRASRDMTESRYDSERRDRRNGNDRNDRRGDDRIVLRRETDDRDRRRRSDSPESRRRTRTGDDSDRRDGGRERDSASGQRREERSSQARNGNSESRRGRSVATVYLPHTDMLALGGETIAAGGNLPPLQMDDAGESSTQQFVPPTRESIMASRQNGTAGGAPAARKRVVPLIEVIANDRLGGKGNALDRNQCSPLLT